MNVITFRVNSQVLRDAENHLQLATQERSFYRKAIDKSKVALKDTFTIDGLLQVPPVNCCLLPASHDIEMHFSLDMAQQVRSLYMYVNHYKLTCTLPIRCTIPVIHSSLDQSIFLRHTSVPFSESVVRQFRDRWD